MIRWKNACFGGLAAVLAVFIVHCGHREESRAPKYIPRPGFIQFSGDDPGIGISVRDSCSGRALKDAEVIVYDPLSGKVLDRKTTDEAGTADFPAIDHRRPYTITVTGCGRRAYDPISFLEMTAAHIEVPLTPRGKRRRRRIRFRIEGLSKDDVVFLFTMPGGKKRRIARAELAETAPDVATISLRVPVPAAVSVTALDVSGNRRAFGMNVFNDEMLRKTGGRVVIRCREIAGMHRNRFSGKVLLPETPDIQRDQVDLAVIGDFGLFGEIPLGTVKWGDSFDFSGEYYPEVHPHNVLVRASIHGHAGGCFRCIAQKKICGLSEPPRKATGLRLKLVAHPGGVVIDTAEFMDTPEIRWTAELGNVHRAIIESDVSYFRWIVYRLGTKSDQQVAVPWRLPGAVGSLVPGEKYHVCTEDIEVSSLDTESQWYMADMDAGDVLRLRSEKYRFQVPEMCDHPRPGDGIRTGSSHPI